MMVFTAKHIPLPRFDQTIGPATRGDEIDHFAAV